MQSAAPLSRSKGGHQVMMKHWHINRGYRLRLFDDGPQSIPESNQIIRKTRCRRVSLQAGGFRVLWPGGRGLLWYRGYFHGFTR